MDSEPSKHCFDTCELLFRSLVVYFHGVINKVLIIEGIVKILISGSKVVIQDIGNCV